jgi:hypothetical protein
VNNRVQVNVLEVVNSPCTDVEIYFPCPTVCTKHELSSMEQHVKRAKNKLKDIT